MLDSRDVGRVGRMQFNRSLGVLLCTLSAAIILLYWFAPGIRVVLPDATAIFAGAVAIYAAYYARAALISRIQGDRLRRTFEIMGRYNRPDLCRVRRSLVGEAYGSLSCASVQSRQRDLLGVASKANYKGGGTA